MNTKKDAVGINISGYIHKDFGLGVAVRSNIDALKAAGIPYVVNDIQFSISDDIKNGEHHFENLVPDNPYDINLIQINFDNLHNFFNDKSKEYFEGKYNIGFWAWELDSLPDEALPFFHLLDEIWTPSNFCVEAISKKCPLPLLKVLHPISIHEPVLQQKLEFKMQEEAFVFLTMFDYNSNIERKNPFAVIESFNKAFGKNNSKVQLVIKTSLSHHFSKEKEMLTQKIGNSTNIILIEEILEENKLHRLINSCDCFVSLHRSEGFGLTMAEAMYFGKPVIATGYSGNTDFMNVNNSFLVKYNLISTQGNYYRSTEKDVWADSDTAHVSELMKFVFEYPEKAKKIGERAKQDIHDFLSPKKIGALIQERIHVIATDILPCKNVESKNSQFLQFENEILQKKIAILRNLFPVKMKERFKNFQNKISGKNRKYFWE